MFIDVDKQPKFFAALRTAVADKGFRTSNHEVAEKIISFTGREVDEMAMDNKDYINEEFEFADVKQSDNGNENEENNDEQYENHDYEGKNEENEENNDETEGEFDQYDENEEINDETEGEYDQYDENEENYDYEQDLYHDDYAEGVTDPPETGKRLS